MLLFIRGKIMPEAKNPVNRFLIWVYRPIITGVMRWKKLTVLAALVVLGVSYYPASRLGSEFMPTLNEGSLLYMPASLPGMSITKAAELLQTQDKIIKSFPEVTSVFGKAGRANTATDPAPTEMFETVINLKPESEWRAGMTIDKLIADKSVKPQLRVLQNIYDNGIITGVGPDKDFCDMVWDNPVGYISPVFTAASGDILFFRTLEETPTTAQSFTELEPRIYGMLKNQRQSTQQETVTHLLLQPNHHELPQRCRRLPRLLYEGFPHRRRTQGRSTGPPALQGLPEKIPQRRA